MHAATSRRGFGYRRLDIHPMGLVFRVVEICFEEKVVLATARNLYTSPTLPIVEAPETKCRSGLFMTRRRRTVSRSLTRLPWGSPVFDGVVEGRTDSRRRVHGAKFVWERSHGMARSSNVMSDGSCLRFARGQSGVNVTF